MKKKDMVEKLSLKAANKGLITLVIAATTITSGIVVYEISQFGLVGKTEKSEPIETTFKNQKVAALGRLEPEAEVISLFAPLALDGDRIAKILVKEGNRVKLGQIVAILDARHLGNCRFSRSCRLLPRETIWRAKATGSDRSCLSQPS